MAGNSSGGGRIGSLVGSIAFTVATTPQLRALFEEIERRKLEAIREQLAAERFVFCEHRGATMSVRAHARMHAEERHRWRARRGVQPPDPALLEALELELRED